MGRRRLDFVTGRLPPRETPIVAVEPPLALRCMKLRGAPNLVQSTSPPAEINVNAAYRRTSVIRPEMGAAEDTNDWRRMGASMGVLIWAMGLSPKNADDPFREAMALG